MEKDQVNSDGFFMSMLKDKLVLRLGMLWAVTEVVAVPVLVSLFNYTLRGSVFFLMFIALPILTYLLLYTTFDSKRHIRENEYYLKRGLMVYILFAGMIVIDNVMRYLGMNPTYQEDLLLDLLKMAGFKLGYGILVCVGTATLFLRFKRRKS